MAAREPIYSDEVKAEVLRRLALGHSLREIHSTDGMPAPSTVVLWAADDPAFAEQYTRARACGLEVHADEIIEISDDARNDWMERHREDGSVELVINSEHINRSRLRIESRKWLLSKLVPKKYGERLELAGDQQNPLLTKTWAEVLAEKQAERAREAKEKA